MPIADWEDDEAYRDLIDADPGRLAWELLRRQPRFREAVAQGEDLTPFGLMFGLDPDNRASEVDPIWRWEVAPLLAVRFAPSNVGEVTAGHVLERAVYARRSEAGVFTRFPNGLQAMMPPDIRPGASVAGLLPFGRELFARISAIRALQAGLFGRWRRVDGSSRVKRQRLVRSLRAWDARDDGASYRQIAHVLLRPPVMNSLEWRTSSERATVIRLCAAGAALVRGGYLGLLGSRVTKTPS